MSGRTAAGRAAGSTSGCCDRTRTPSGISRRRRRSTAPSARCRVAPWCTAGSHAGCPGSRAPGFAYEVVRRIADEDADKHLPAQPAVSRADFGRRQGCGEGGRPQKPDHRATGNVQRPCLPWDCSCCIPPPMAPFISKRPARSIRNHSATPALRWQCASPDSKLSVQRLTVHGSDPAGSRGRPISSQDRMQTTDSENVHVKGRKYCRFRSDP